MINWRELKEILRLKHGYNAIVTLIFSYLLVIFLFLQDINVHTELIGIIPGWVYFIMILSIVLIAIFIRNFDFTHILLLILSLIFLFNSGLSLSPSRIYSQSGDNSITICSINSHYFFGKRKEERIKKMKDLDCDIYLLSEVREHDKNYTVTPQEVEELLRNEFDNYFLSKEGEFLTVSKGDIEKSYLAQYEGYQFSKINLDGRSYYIYNTHIVLPAKNPYRYEFSDPSTPQIMPIKLRKLQMDVLEKDYKSHLDNSDPVIITGDFNINLNHKIIKRLDQDMVRLELAPLNIQGSLTSYFPILRVDHTFISSNLENSISNYDIQCIPSLTDHCIQKIHLNSN